MPGVYGKEVCILQKGDKVVLLCFMQCIDCSHCPPGNKIPFLFCLSQLFRINHLLLVHMPPLSDTDVLDHPGLNTSILESSMSFVFDIRTNNYNTCIFTIFDVFDMKCMYFIYLPYKGSPWDTEFYCPLVMMDLSQCLGSRVPPLDPVPPLSLALMYNHVAWDRLWVPPHALLFEQSCTINTCILHIFDIFDIITIYSTCILNIL